MHKKTDFLATFGKKITNVEEKLIQTEENLNSVFDSCIKETDTLLTNFQTFDDSLFSDDEIDIIYDLEDQISESGSESEEEDDYTYGFLKVPEENINAKPEIIKDDFQPILTLSSSSEIKNKKTETINRVFTSMLKNFFPFSETIIFHSIYNYNPLLLTTRNSNYKEVPLLVYILNLFEIRPTNAIFKLLFIYPYKLDSKRYISFIQEIKDSFDFKEFKENNNLKTHEEPLPISKQIQFYVNSYVLLLKNILLMKKQDLIQNYNLSSSEIDSFNSNFKSTAIFLNDKNIQTLASFFNYKTKSICYDHFFNNVVQSIKNEEKSLNKEEISHPTLISLESRVHESIVILMKLILLYNKSKQNQTIKDKLKIFLLWNIEDKIIEKVIEDKAFISGIKYLLSNIHNFTYTKRIKLAVNNFLVKIEENQLQS